MNFSPRATAAALSLASALVLPSCFPYRAAGQKSLAFVKDTTHSAMGKLSDIDIPFSHLLPGQRVKIAEVRQRDLKELPNGQQLAKNYERKHDALPIAGISVGPVNFQETLPTNPDTMDGSLLPPRP